MYKVEEWKEEFFVNFAEYFSGVSNKKKVFKEQEEWSVFFSLQ